MEEVWVEFNSYTANSICVTRIIVSHRFSGWALDFLQVAALDVILSDRNLIGLALDKKALVTSSVISNS